MILIADSGSTKVDWRAVKDNGDILSVSTEGLNPVFVSEEFIVSVLKTKLVPLVGFNVDKIFFYGAGLVALEQLNVLKVAFSNVFGNVECFMASDLLGAARALCGDKPGIAAILGTGGNSCFYDGKDILKNVKAGGFILGDEGSGACIGKHFISDFIKGLLPAHIEKKFILSYGLNYAQIVERVYRQPLPNRFLASFVPFIAELIDDAYVRELVVGCIEDFFRRNIYQYDYKNYAVNVVGSVGYYFYDCLKEAAERCGVKIGQVLKSPIDGLVEYHKVVR